MKRAFKVLAIVVLLLIAAFIVAVYALNFHPDPVMAVPVHCAADDGSPRSSPLVPAGAELKVMTWNVQFMAGKGYVFWWELPDDKGPDERPSGEAIQRTLDEVARVIIDEGVDIVLLQEVDDGAKRTDGADQLAALLHRLPQASWACHASAFYWKSAFVPHPRIWGSGGMKLSIISRYQIREATRFQLAQKPDDIVTRQFALKRAALAVTLPIEPTVDGPSSLAVLNTHLDAFAQGSDTMTRQVGEVKRLVESLSGPWILGGDFNLLPDDGAREHLGEVERGLYPAPTELTPLTQAFTRVPSVEDTSGADRAQWYTHFGNHPDLKGPDRTIDYLFVGGGVEVTASGVRNHDTLEISDHLPVIATVKVPAPAAIEPVSPR